MKEFLTVERNEMVYTMSGRFGGNYGCLYTYELPLSKDRMVENRYPFYTDPFWLKSYNDVKKTREVTRKAKSTFNFLVLTVNVKKENDILVYTVNRQPFEDIDLSFGQFYLPGKHISLYKAFHTKVDVSINSKSKYASIDSEASQILLENRSESIDSFLLRYGYSPIGSSNPLSAVQTDASRLGINPITSNRSIEQTEGLEVIKDLDYMNVSDSCFSWYTSIPTGQKLNKTLIVDVKHLINSQKIKDWIEVNFKSQLESLIISLGSTDSLDFNFIIHPPIFEGLQYEEKPIIISPMKGNTVKISDSISFRVPRSLIKNSMTYYKVRIKMGDKEFEDNSFDSPSSFKVSGSTHTYVLSKPELVNSSFSSVSADKSEEGSFRVEYTIPTGIVGLLPINTPYEIEVSLSDLTSIRK